MSSPPDRKYTKEHEWVTEDGTIGITDYAQDQLGDIVFVDMPPVGTKVSFAQVFGEIESVKAVSELFSPVSGEITGRNEELTNNPQLVNESPYEDGWLLKVTLSNPEELERLMNANEYDNFIQGPGN